MPAHPDYLDAPSEAPTVLGGREASLFWQPQLQPPRISGVSRARTKDRRCGLQVTENHSKWLEQNREPQFIGAKPWGSGPPHGSGPPRPRRVTDPHRTSIPGFNTSQGAGSTSPRRPLVTVNRTPAGETSRRACPSQGPGGPSGMEWSPTSCTAGWQARGGLGCGRSSTAPARAPHAAKISRASCVTCAPT